MRIGPGPGVVCLRFQAVLSKLTRNSSTKQSGCERVSEQSRSLTLQRTSDDKSGEQVPTVLTSEDNSDETCPRHRSPSLDREHCHRPGDRSAGIGPVQPGECPGGSRIRSLQRSCDLGQAGYQDESCRRKRELWTK